MGKNEFATEKLKVQEDSTINNSLEIYAEGKILTTKEKPFEENDEFHDSNGSGAFYDDFEQDIEIISNKSSVNNDIRTEKIHETSVEFDSKHGTFTVGVETRNSNEDYFKSKSLNTGEILHSTPIASSSNQRTDSKHTKQDLSQNENYCFVSHSQNATEILSSTPATCESIDAECEDKDHNMRTENFLQINERKSINRNDSKADDYAHSLNNSYMSFEHDYCVRTLPTVNSSTTCNQINDSSQADVLETQVNYSLKQMLEAKVIKLQNKDQIETQSKKYTPTKNTTGNAKKKYE